MKNVTKEELQKQLNKIAIAEEKEMIAKHYPEFKKFEGRYFKQRNNYSCPKKPSDYWFMYTKITEINPKDVYDTRGNGVACYFKGWTFQTCRDGHISINKEKHGYIHGLGKEITEKEFNDAWNTMIDKINSLYPTL